MPLYEYHCEANGASIEVRHSIHEDLTTWGELCARARVPLGETPADAPVERVLFAPALATPMGNSKLKELGFAKLVRRDQGVYENVTAQDHEKRYVRADDPSSMPDLKKRVGD